MWLTHVAFPLALRYAGAHVSRAYKGILDMQHVATICSSQVIHSPKYSYVKFIFEYSEIISQPSNYTAHNNTKSRISR